MFWILTLKMVQHTTMHLCLVFLIWNLSGLGEQWHTPGKNNICNKNESIRNVFHSQYSSTISCKSLPKTHFVTLIVSAQNLPEFTTEEGIFTGLSSPTPTTPEPLLEFDMSVKEIFGTFIYLNVSWNDSVNLTKVLLKFVNEGDIVHTVEIPVEAMANLTKNQFNEDARRLGFIYKLGALKKQRRFYLQGWGYSEKFKEPFYDTVSFLTGDTDTDDRLYNLNGIFMVLGISTILMVMVMVCVGYEKILHQKKKACINFMCCRRKKESKNKVNIGLISPEPLSRRNNQGIRSLEDEYERPGANRTFAF